MKVVKILISIVLVVLIAICASIFITMRILRRTPPPELRTNYGDVVGYYKYFNGKQKYMAFEGIPYASPPIGERRFKPPEPPRSWIRDWPILANSLPPHCMGLTWYPNATIDGVEDCLYLNVYAPLIAISGTLLPVILWIDGNVFQFSSLTGTEHLPFIVEQFVFVTFNYRQGVLGFLSTDDDEITGNMGLKDQAMALKWVSENIEVFGGDPKRITIAGVGAGAVSVHLHYMSKWSRGLFMTGVSFGGSAFDSWTMMDSGREKTLLLADELGCLIGNTTAVVECLRKLPADELVAASKIFQVWQNFPLGALSAVIENNSEDPFIDKSPMEIVMNGDVYDVPWIAGRLRQESFSHELSLTDDALKDLNTRWEIIAPFLLNYNYITPDMDQVIISQRIKEYYFSSGHIDKKNQTNLVKLLNDRLYGVGLEVAAKMQAKTNSQTYLYYYNYEGAAPIDSVSIFTKSDGHTLSMNETDVAMRNEIVKLWTSVTDKRISKAKLEWQPVSKNGEDITFLDIAGPRRITLNETLTFSNRRFWEYIGLSL